MIWLIDLMIYYIEKSINFPISVDSANLPANFTRF